jgi:ribosome biogenesis GTPase A
MLPNFLLLNKRDLVDAAYLQDISKSQQDIEVFKKKYSVFDFRVVSAKTTAGTEFINLF